MNKKKAFVLSALKFSIPTIVSSVVAVFVLPFISRCYPEEEYGYISNFYSVGNMLMSLAFLGLDSAYIRFFYEKLENTDRNGIFQFVMKFALTITLLASVLAIIFFHKQISFLLFNDAGNTGLVILEIYVALLVVFRLITINCRFQEKIFAYNLLQIFFVICNRLIYICATVISTRYIYSVSIITVGTAFIVCIGLLSQKDFFKRGKIDLEAKQTLLRFSLPLVPASVCIQLTGVLSRLFLSGFGFYKEVGVFSIAVSIANIISVIPAGFCIYWSPYIYKNYKKEQEWIKQIHDIVLSGTIILIIIVFLFQEFIYSFLGEGYRGSQPYFMIIMLLPVSALLCETTGYGVLLSNNTKISLFISFCSMIVDILICAILVPATGGIGAAYGIGISSAVSFFLKTVFGQKYYCSINNWKRTIIGSSLIIAICLLNQAYYDKFMERVFISVIATGIVFVVYRKMIIAIYNLFTDRRKNG